MSIFIGIVLYIISFTFSVFNYCCVRHLSNHWPIQSLMPPLAVGCWGHLLCKFQSRNKFCKCFEKNVVSLVVRVYNGGHPVLNSNQIAVGCPGSNHLQNKQGLVQDGLRFGSHFHHLLPGGLLKGRQVRNRGDGSEDVPLFFSGGWSPHKYPIPIRTYLADGSSEYCGCWWCMSLGNYLLVFLCFEVVECVVEGFVNSSIKMSGCPWGQVDMWQWYCHQIQRCLFWKRGTFIVNWSSLDELDAISQ